MTMRLSFIEDGMVRASETLPITTERYNELWEDNNLEDVCFYTMQMDASGKSWDIYDIEDANKLYFYVESLKKAGLMDKFLNWLDCEDQVNLASAFYAMEKVYLGFTKNSLPKVPDEYRFARIDAECARLKQASGYSWEFFPSKHERTYSCNHGFITEKNGTYTICMEDRVLEAKPYTPNLMDCVSSISFQILTDRKEDIYDFLRKNAKLEKSLNLIKDV